MKLWLAIGLSLLFAHGVKAEGPVRSTKNVGLGLSGGLPQLISLEMSLLTLSPLTFGLTYGSAPINGIINRQLNLKPIPIDVGGGLGSFEIVPNASFSLTSFSGYVRYYFGNEWFFAQLGYGALTFKASVSAGLRNKDTGASVGGIVSGSATLVQPMVYPAIGGEVLFPFGLYMNLGLGAGYLLKLKKSISIGGTAVSYASLLPETSAALNEAKAKLETEFNQKVDEIRELVNWSPVAFISLGLAF